MELAKSFDPADMEAFWRSEWEQRGYFTASVDPSKPSISIQLQPPNVTGNLHMGPAFNQTIMDGLTRYTRSRDRKSGVEGKGGEVRIAHSVSWYSKTKKYE